MLFRAMSTSGSALTAGRLQMDVIAHNLANINTTRTEAGDPYRRRVVVQQERRFRDELARAENGPRFAGGGIQVQQIQEDNSPYRLKHDPAHPDADENGMVRLPNVDMLQEITDLMMAVRVYEANTTAFNASKSMTQRALEIGR